MNGKITGIQRFCLDDGPGIRTTVFLKGCSLRCFWCHNPETVSPQSELQFYPPLCAGCGRCREVCPSGAMASGAFDRLKCTGCGLCAGVCCSGARVLAGRDVSTEEVLQTVLRDEPYYTASGGGVTLSGGEPMMQRGFAGELFELCHARGIHTALETAGNVPWEWFEDILAHVDLFLYDVKHVDDAKHRQATGDGCGRIIANLESLLRRGARVVVRVPVIPGFNADEESVRSIAGFLNGMEGIERVEPMSFHLLGLGKYESLGRECSALGLRTQTEEDMENVKNQYGGIGRGKARVLHGHH